MIQVINRAFDIVVIGYGAIRAEYCVELHERLGVNAMKLKAGDVGGL